MAGAEPADRQRYRENLEREFNAPLDPIEREEYDRENWGTDSEALAAQEASAWEGATYGEE